MANSGFDNERFRILRKLRFSSPRDRKIAEFCLQGSNCAEIGRFFGLTRQRVLQIVRGYGLELIPRKLTVSCEKCSKSFTKFRTLIVKSKHHFCSRECAETARKEQAVNAACCVCGKACKKKKTSTRPFCSQRCYHSLRQDGRYVPRRSGQRKARKVVSGYFQLQPGNVVHHEDRDNNNNSLSNLMVFATQADHMAYHHGVSEVKPLWDGRNVREI